MKRIFQGITRFYGGLSFAYCDNDTPGESPPRRDLFFDSVYVPASAYNDHWLSAGWFGVSRLTGNQASSSIDTANDGKLKMDRFVTNGKVNVSVYSSSYGKVNVRILKILGREIFRKKFY